MKKPDIGTQVQFGSKDFCPKEGVVTENTDCDQSRVRLSCGRAVKIAHEHLRPVSSKAILGPPENKAVSAPDETKTVEAQNETHTEGETHSEDGSGE